MSRVLVVDDEKGLRLTMREFLRDAGHGAEMAASAPEALEKMGLERFDIVVADIILPDVDGISLLGSIREGHPDVLVILITGEPSYETASEAVRTGAFDYLGKPVTKEMLLGAVERAGRVSDLERQNRRYREELERTLEERTRVLREARRLAHDFNNQLAIIIGQVSLASSDIEPGSPLRGDLDQIAAAADRATDLNRQLRETLKRGDSDDREGSRDLPAGSRHPS